MASESTGRAEGSETGRENSISRLHYQLSKLPLGNSLTLWGTLETMENILFPLKGWGYLYTNPHQSFCSGSLRGLGF